jgi:hypothetical protein
MGGSFRELCDLCGGIVRYRHSTTMCPPCDPLDTYTQWTRSLRTEGILVFRVLFVDESDQAKDTLGNAGRM